MTEHTFGKVLDLSTAHLTEYTAKHLSDIHTDIDRLPFAGGVTCYGWLAYCHDENCGEGDDRIPDDLFKLMEYGRSVGAEYLLLDCDGPTIDGLPVYEW